MLVESSLPVMVFISSISKYTGFTRRKVNESTNLNSFLMIYLTGVGSNLSEAPYSSKLTVTVIHIKLANVDRFSLR